MPSLSIVFDTALWGPMEPISGGRSMLTIAKAFPVSKNSYSFETLIGDTRHYFRLGRRSSLAFRLVGVASRGEDAQRFFLGGTYTIRGHEDFEFVGTKAMLANLEIRYPFIDELRIAGPIPLYLGGIRGVAFFDAGSAWDDTNMFRGAKWDEGEYRFKDIKAGYGFGARMALSFLLLRLDFGWPTDMASTGKMRVHFAIGGQF